MPLSAALLLPPRTDGLAWANQRNVTLESIYPFNGTTSTCNLAAIQGATSAQVVRTTGAPGFAQPVANSATELMAAVAAQPVAVVFNGEAQR